MTLHAGGWQFSLYFSLHLYHTQAPVLPDSSSLYVYSIPVISWLRTYMFIGLHLYVTYFLPVEACQILSSLSFLKSQNNVPWWWYTFLVCGVMCALCKHMCISSGKRSCFVCWFLSSLLLSSLSFWNSFGYSPPHPFLFPFFFCSSVLSWTLSLMGDFLNSLFQNFLLNFHFS